MRQPGKWTSRIEIGADFFIVLGLSFAMAELGLYLLLNYGLGIPFKLTMEESLGGGAAFAGTSGGLYFLLSRLLG